MLRKLSVLAAAALLSLNASAGYIQYDIASTDGLSGYFIQNEADRSIAFYDFRISTDRIHESIIPLGDIGYLEWARARYDNTGPTRFAAYNATSGDYYSRISFNFSAMQSAGTYSFTSYFHAVEDEARPDDPWLGDIMPVSHYFNGTVTQTAIDPELAAYLDAYLLEMDEYPDGLEHIPPRLNVIPEPTSIALLALGAAGLAGASRRRKARR